MLILCDNELRGEYHGQQSTQISVASTTWIVVLLAARDQKAPLHFIHNHAPKNNSLPLSTIKRLSVVLVTVVLLVGDVVHAASSATAEFLSRRLYEVGVLRLREQCISRWRRVNPSICIILFTVVIMGVKESLAPPRQDVQIFTCNHQPCPSFVIKISDVSMLYRELTGYPRRKYHQNSIHSALSVPESHQEGPYPLSEAISGREM